MNIFGLDPNSKLTEAGIERIKKGVINNRKPKPSH